MKLAIMQPYFLPYIGYWALMNAVDEYIVYDNIQYTKKGWFNRNRILVNGTDSYITIPIKKDSDHLDVKDRYISDEWNKDSCKILNRIRELYRKAPYFKEVYPIIESCVLYPDRNLFSFIFHSMNIVKDYLSIKTPLVISSSIDIDHNLKAEERVKALCIARRADTYINPIGGIDLYNKQDFENDGISLCFLKVKEIQYKQFDKPFVPWLSILDITMFNNKENIQKMLESYTKE